MEKIKIYPGVRTKQTNFYLEKGEKVDHNSDPRFTAII